MSSIAIIISVVAMTLFLVVIRILLRNTIRIKNEEKQLDAQIKRNLECELVFTLANKKDWVKSSVATYAVASKKTPQFKASEIIVFETTTLLDVTPN